jgi:hypothetical protein
MAKHKVKVRDPRTAVDYVQFGPAVRRQLTPEGESLTGHDLTLALALLEQGDETNRLLAELVYRMENMLWLK